VSVRRRSAVAEKAPCVADAWEDRCVVVDVDDGDADANNPEVRHRSHGHVEPDVARVVVDGAPTEGVAVQPLRGTDRPAALVDGEERARWYASVGRGGAGQQTIAQVPGRLVVVLRNTANQLVGRKFLQYRQVEQRRRSVGITENQPR